MLGSAKTFQAFAGIHESTRSAHTFPCNWSTSKSRSSALFTCRFKYETSIQLAGFASNKLEWTSIQLGYDGKVQHRGFQLWLDCMNGDASAWREMKRYNLQDVRLLEDMYAALLPWIKNHPNWGLYVDADKNRICTNCGSSKVKKNGFERTRVRTYRRYRCLRCGNPLRGRTQFHKTAKGVLT